MDFADGDSGDARQAEEDEWVVEMEDDDEEEEEEEEEEAEEPWDDTDDDDDDDDDDLEEDTADEASKGAARAARRFLGVAKTSAPMVARPQSTWTSQTKEKRPDAKPIKSTPRSKARRSTGRSPRSAEGVPWGW